jgi:hypothetical protein
MTDVASDTRSDEAPADDNPAKDFYCVDPNFTPRSAQSGSQRTDHQGAFDVRNISGAFSKAYRRSVLTARHALDPNNPTPASHVTFPTAESPSHESVTERLRNLADKVEAEVGLSVEDHFAAGSDRSPAALDRAREAADSSGDSSAAEDKAPADAPKAVAPAAKAPEAPSSPAASGSAPSDSGAAPVSAGVVGGSVASGPGSAVGNAGGTPASPEAPSGK